MKEDINYLFSKNENTEEISKVVVRVITSTWWSGSEINYKKTIRFLARKSQGYNYIAEEVSNIGSDSIFESQIVNIFDVKDGIYEVVTNSVSRDWETGMVDDWDYKLVEYKE